MDETITAARYTDATVLRVTPLGGDGSPAHSWAMTYHLDVPVMFGLGTARDLPPFLGTYSHISISIRQRIAGALVAEYEHPQYRDLQAAAQGIWQRRRTGAAVETWCESGNGTWWYALVPCWRHQTDTDQWPLKHLAGHHVYALGDCRPVTGYAWPAQAPLPAPKPLRPGTQVVLAETTVAPPAPGFPPAPWDVA